ncbi:flagellar protein FlaG [Hydrogenothermus marinus]|uniref:Flagellar protein FlaG n=1 Tax=Hydrogenothermus marinus TaxID=133270 RepID=A0A3M0B7A0_9AQUI|nr:flagellar protein FlaG [Hydrogenothermus marinus]RMA93253.1 flagellar protein FlaG [Hydrogenothermus marinus]
MDIKAVQNQALSSMNSQNIEIQKASEKQILEQTKENQLDEKTKKADVHSPEDIVNAANKINEKLKMLDSQLKIEFDKDTGIKVVKIVDKETDQVIRQIPPEVVLKIAKYLDELTGLLFNEKA